MERYKVEINGIETELLLSDEDAKARGLKPVSDKADVPETKAKTPANKARTPAAAKRDAANEKHDEAVARAFNKPSKGNA